MPIATALVIVGHPPDPSTATDLGPATDRHIAIHLARECENRGRR